MNLTADNNGVIILYAQWTDDTDGDGVKNIEENSGLNNGDANNDGILDSMQSNTTTYLNSETNLYNTFISNGGKCNQILNIRNVSESNLGTDVQYTYPMGLWKFEILCDNPGDVASVTILLDKVYDTSMWKFRKFNSNFYDISPVVMYGTFNNGLKMVTTITYNVIDGGSLDNDGLANKKVIDPAGVALEIKTLPKTGAAAYPWITTGTILLINSLFIILYTKRRTIMKI